MKERFQEAILHLYINVVVLWNKKIKNKKSLYNLTANPSS